MKMRPIINNAVFLALALILSFIFLINTASAETKIFIKEFTYQASDEDSLNSSRTIALREIKKLLLDELGTYLESQTEVKNLKLTKDQIVTLTAGIVQTEIVEEKWNTENLKYWLKAKITANPPDVIKSIESLRKDLVKVKELEELRKNSEQLLKENERLNKELKIAKGDAKQESAKLYKRNIDSLNATERSERGYKLGIPGNNTDAEKNSKAAERNPPDAKAYYNSGLAYSKLGNNQQAIKDYNKAIELNPQLAEAYSDRGVAYDKLGNYQQAVKDYNKAIELNPQYAEAYYNRGVCYGLFGNYQQAIKDYTSAIKLNPQYAMAYNNRGVAYDKLGNYQQAIKDYTSAVKLNPQYAMAYNNRGVAYDKLGNNQQAIKDSNKAVELNPQYAMAYNNRGVAYSKPGNYQQAIKDYNKAIKLNPQLAEAYIGRGVAYLIQGNEKLGCHDAQKACALGKCEVLGQVKGEGLCR